MAKMPLSRADKAHSITRLTKEYYLIVGDDQMGPFKINQLWDLYWEGRINDRDQYWTEGLSEWMPIPALYHSRGLPYARPLQQAEPEPPIQSTRDGGFFRSLFSPSNSKTKFEATITEYSVRAFAQRCTLCNGPALPMCFRCSRHPHKNDVRNTCGYFCRQCIKAVGSPSECPLCGAGTVAKK
jgi:hypothetical protein